MSNESSNNIKTTKPMQLTQKLILAAKKNKQTPFLLTDLSAVTTTYKRLKRALPKTEIHFSIKSNNDPVLLSHLNSIGSYFDVASWREIYTAHKEGVSTDRMVYSTPIKKSSEIAKAYKLGVREFAYDSTEEVDKLAKYAPEAKLILRILVDSDGSQCPMFKKFGVYVDEALKYLLYAKLKGFETIGLTFHVGSQCLQPTSWKDALRRANRVWNDARLNGIQLTLMNLGGGLPVSYDAPIISIEEITATIKEELAKNFVGMKKTYIEPGRYMTDNASVMVTTVIGKASRGAVEWIFLDVGGFHGLFEIFEKFQYDIQVPNASDRPKKTYAVAGPTCDGMDIIRQSIVMPEVSVGERVYVMNAGAYSTSKRSYNGMRWAVPRCID